MSGLPLPKTERYGLRIEEGDIIWRQADLHAADGVVPLDAEVRQQPSIAIGRNMVSGFIAMAVSGDIEQCGTLPRHSNEMTRDKALRACQRWIPNDRQPGKFVGMSIFLPDAPPAGWTHIRVSKVSRINLADGRPWYMYSGEWVSDPGVMLERYRNAYLATLTRGRSGADLLNSAGVRDMLDTQVFSLEKLQRQLSVDRIHLGATTQVVNNPTMPQPSDSVSTPASSV